MKGIHCRMTVPTKSQYPLCLSVFANISEKSEGHQTKTTKNSNWHEMKDETEVYGTWLL